MVLNAGPTGIVQRAGRSCLLAVEAASAAGSEIHRDSRISSAPKRDRLTAGPSGGDFQGGTARSCRVSVTGWIAHRSGVGDTLTRYNVQ